jgi:hypothetical protein
MIGQRNADALEFRRLSQLIDGQPHARHDISQPTSACMVKAMPTA